MAISKKLVKNEPGKKTNYRDEATNKRIHEHLANEKDVITKEDISNAKTDDLVNENPGNEADTESKDIKDNSDTDIDTSWNILESESL